MLLPLDHPQRQALAEEVHSRPPVRLQPPALVSYLALIVADTERDAERAALIELCQRAGVAAPAPDAQQVALSLPGFGLKWERHTEFTGYTFYRARLESDSANATALDAVPADWVAGLPGRTLVAAHVSVAPHATADPDIRGVADELGAESVIGARISDGAGWAFTDFRVRADGFSRFAVFDRSFTPSQAGRVVQRLLEIETYRMMALMAFPVARRTAAELSAAERELSDVTDKLVHAADSDDTALLDALSALAARVERSIVSNKYRFRAADAYYALVQRRIEELREQRLPGVQTIAEFMERRLAPAMNTCAAVARRQDELSERIARAGDLLRTRVDVAHEQQNQALLASMNQRAQLQLRLQQTVEGLSVAAITYYGAGLVGYVAKAVKGFWPGLNPDIAMAISIPLIAFATWRAVHRLRSEIARRQP